MIVTGTTKYVPTLDETAGKELTPLLDQGTELHVGAASLPRRRSRS